MLTGIFAIEQHELDPYGWRIFRKYSSQLQDYRHSGCAVIGTQNRSIPFGGIGIKFGNGAGVIGVIPGETMKFLVGKSHEAFDDEGVLAVKMYYPHSRQSLLEVSQAGSSHIRVAGLMHEPSNGQAIEMAGPMGMVKLFVRTGVQVVADVYQSYREMMEKLDMPDKSFAVAIVHHANYKINKLKEKHLAKLGISFPMPWLVSDFGNVSAASNMIAFLRQLPSLNPGDHILFDGFGAGTYYDVLAVSLGS